jgi:type IV pilus assembly protein PilM
VSKHTVGLEVGTSAVRLAAVSRGRSGGVLQRLAEVPLPPATVVDGDLVDPAGLTAAVKALVRAARPGTRAVRIGLVSQRTVAREVDLPWVPKKEFDAALPLLAGDMLPMPAEDCVLDFLQYEDRTETDGHRCLRGLLVAAPQAAVLDMVDAVEAGGLEVHDVTLTPLSTLAAVADAMAAGPEAVIDVGHSMTSITVHEAGQPRFVRVLSRGGQDITTGLAEHLSIPETDAETWKRGLWQLWPGMSTDDRAATEAAMRAAVADLVTDIRTSLEFFAAGEGNRVMQAYLVGGAAATLGLVEILAGVLRVPVRAVSAQFLTPGRAIGEAGWALAASPAATSAVGLALGAAA